MHSLIRVDQIVVIKPSGRNKLDNFVSPILSAVWMIDEGYGIFGRKYCDCFDFEKKNEKLKT